MKSWAAFGSRMIHIYLLKKLIAVHEHNIDEPAACSRLSSRLATIESDGTDHEKPP